MNIAIFTDTYFPAVNGVASSIYTLSNGLISKGHHVYIFSIQEHATTIKLTQMNPPVFQIPSVPVFFLKPYRAVLPVVLDVVELLKKFKIDIIHSQTEFSMGFMAQFAATSISVPLIHTYHTMLEDYTYYVAHGKIITPAAAQRFSAYYVDKVDALIVPTEKVKDSLISYGAKNKSIHIIPSGINLEPFKKENNSASFTKEIKEKFGIKPSDKVLLSIGRIAKEKSIDMVIRQMPSILEIDPNILFVVIGKGPAEDELKALASELNLKDRVIFPGSVKYEDVGKYYQIGHAFISCSTSETQGLTYYEALAAGLPVIARYDDCIANVLQNNVNSKVFKTASELTDCVRVVFENKAKWEQMSIAAADSVKDFDGEVFASRVEKAYMDTINCYNNTRAKRDNVKVIHMAYKTQDFLNKTVALSFNGTKKVYKPLVRRTRNWGRKVSKLLTTRKHSSIASITKPIEEKNPEE